MNLNLATIRSNSISKAGHWAGWDRYFCWTVLVWIAIVGSGFADQPVADRPASDLISRGQAIYSQQCQSCHGEGGRGQTDAYSDPLSGDSSLGELTEIIVDTMPEEDPEQCVGADAEAVAKYIYESFYSAAAQLRNRPPQQQLSRLTGGQVEQSLADLYQHFYEPPWRETKQGLNGAYFDAGRWDKDKLKLERVDPVLDFDFGRESPVEGVDAGEFYIHWSGSLLVEHSGRYEIVVHSTCSMKMRFGNHDNVLINNNVQSEGKTEFRRSLNLIGGRQYAVLIDFTQRKRKTEMPEAKFSLCWVPPGGTETVIPPENLLPSTLPSSYALQTKLPPDDRSYGYARGTSVDRQWNDAMTAAALDFGNAAAKELWPNYKRKHRKDSDENRGRLRSFLTEMAEVAFRQSLDPETKKLYIDDQLAAVDDDQLAIRRCTLMLIKSPRFLYPLIDEQASESHQVANRLALTLFDSLPSDRWLLEEIRKDKFRLDQKGAVQRIRSSAERMAGDPRLHGKVMQMFFEWLDINPALEITKDPEKYPGFDKLLTLDLRRSLEQTVSEIFWSPESDYRQLFQQDWNWTNQRLHKFYGAAWEPLEAGDSQSLQRSRSDKNVTFGVLTHPLVMSHLSYYETSSPIHRGVFLVRRVLGRTLRPPNEAFTPLNPELHPHLTTRQRVELQTGDAKCQVCHQKINPLGFALENYDAAGRFRSTEHEQPIDSSGGYVTRAGESVSFANTADLARFMAENDDAHRAFIERVFEHFVKQPLAAFGEEVGEKLVTQFRQSGFNMRQLIVEIAVVVATQPQPEETTHGST
ncbi:DUF1588 domain-containing protein [Stieleria sp. TO1_6]|uniref:DUF1588 domain-containing protein n=1 Tax=Stieleria tagensis TaxID=2956795 RepID=UPI00209AD7DC|nr:DUF1588 domain-containing protein [Stieleria tagensis]MCO8120586.1 DUF1588 domain-containing protein [Stieleria tagensis]